MKKLLLLSATLAFLFNGAFAQELSKEEKKKLKDEIKAYLNDLSGYKAKMEDIRVTLDSNDAEIKRQKDDLAYAATKQAELENKLVDFTKELERCNAERTILRGSAPVAGDTTTYPEGKPTGGDEYVTIAESKGETRTSTGTSAKGAAGEKGSSTAGSSTETFSAGSGTGTKAATGRERSPGTAMNNIPKSGTVYKVQVGLYKKFDIKKYFEEPRFIGYEDENGMIRYVISDFTDEGVAMSFVDDVRRMGIKDAFVAKYIDGKRVYEWNKNPKYEGKPVPTSVEEALELEKKGKKGKKIQ
jgi:hypothetical protein